MEPPLYVDENISEGVAEALRDLGYDIVTTTELGRKGASDPEQPWFAGRAGRLLVTHNNVHFQMLHEALLLWSRGWGMTNRRLHAGILCIEQGAIRGGREGIALIVAIIQELPRGTRFEDRLVAWTRRRGLHELTPADNPEVAEERQ